MSSKYLKGTIFKLYEDSNELYIINSSIEREDQIFLLVMPIEDIKEIIIDPKKFILLRVSKDEEITIETDLEITTSIIKEAIEKEKAEEEILKKGKI